MVSISISDFFHDMAQSQAGRSAPQGMSKSTTELVASDTQCRCYHVMLVS